MNNQSKFFFTALSAFLLIVGIFIGTKLNLFNSKITFLLPFKSSADKINSIINFIEEEYVDSVKKDELIEKAVQDLLQNLDPHSAYFTAREVKELNESMQGSFEGIGIEFNVLRDTICIVSIIAGGPSELLGIQAGDKIIKINGKNAAGIKIKNQDVMGKLRGKGGTKVSVSILRNMRKKLIDYTITRGKIPLYSVDVGYMLNKNTGYIKISRFAGTTHNEFIVKTKKLLAEGMKNLISNGLSPTSKRPVLVYLIDDGQVSGLVSASVLHAKSTVAWRSFLVSSTVAPDATSQPSVLMSISTDEPRLMASLLASRRAVWKSDAEVLTR